MWTRGGAAARGRDRRTGEGLRTRRRRPVHRVALGEWVHGGDIREALGEPDAYSSADADDALTILVQRSVAREVPPTDVHLADGRSLRLGDPDTGAEGTLRTDVAGLFRITANRRPELAEAELTGLVPSELRMFF
ncbi:hypothetical protein [Actinokineospora sp.]|uniref:hypothetical protein n=1 Tax=Actinokineospora sp. TaxID=1872133 RepID=UPI003D6AF368